MENLSEVVKILEGALKANASMAANYAGLLADKLDAAGERRQANIIRERLARAPLALASAQDAAGGMSLGSLPADGESRLHTVDVSRPVPDGTALLLPDAIQQRLDEFLAGIQHHNALARAGVALPHRLLIHGPPGTGKTQTARWVAATLRLPLLTVRCDTLISSLLGQTSRNLRRVMEFAQQQQCVLFLDEVDALGSSRGSERDVGELQRIVIALLQNIDALPDDTILIAATNHDSLLDHAIWRRFGFRIPMPLPDEDLRRRLWKEFLGNYAPPNISFSELARLSEAASGALIQQVCLDAKRSAVIGGEPTVTELELFRRLGLALALVRGASLSTTAAEIKWLKEWDGSIFSIRALARMYSVSTRHITNILQPEKKHGNSPRRPRRAAT